MSRVFSVLICVCLGGIAVAAENGQPAQPSDVYQLRYVPDASVRVDGLLDEEDWRKAEPHTRFSFPWRKLDPPPTEFRALCSDTHLYFAFRVEDPDIVLREPFQDKTDVAKEDRVEIFFTADPDLSEYWGLEIDPRGRVLDYRAVYYRQFDRSWSCPGLKTVGKTHATGYVVEGAIPRTTLRSLGLPELSPGNELCIGVYRAEFSHTAGGDIDEAWISWIDPQTAQPDFHVPSSFGTFRVVNADRQ